MSLEETFEKYRYQIQVLFQWSDGDFLKTGEVVSWVYGVGTPEEWRKFLLKKLPAPTHKVPSAVQRFLADLTTKRRRRMKAR